MIDYELLCEHIFTVNFAKLVALNGLSLIIPAILIWETPEFYASSKTKIKKRSRVERTLIDRLRLMKSRVNKPDEYCVNEKKSQLRNTDKSLRMFLSM